MPHWRGVPVPEQGLAGVSRDIQETVMSMLKFHNQQRLGNLEPDSFRQSQTYEA